MAIQGFTGAETGDFSDVVAIAGAPTVQSSTKRTGTYAYQLDSNATFQTVQLCSGLNATQVTARGWFRINISTAPSGGNSNSTHIAIRTATTSIARIRSAISADGSVSLRATNSGGATVGGRTANIQQDVWYRVELTCKTGTTDGIITFRLNGKEIATVTNENNGSTNLDHVQIGGVDSGSGTVGTAWWDDLLYRDDSTFPGDGRSIMLPVVSGTPTYDAFTKNGASGIHQVWNDVPFSATNNAASSAASQAQTSMVDDPLKVTDGLGYQDVVNAVRVGIVAKSITSAGDGTYNIRRRVGGSNTDTAVTLTTTDTYFASGIFTPTIAELRSIEIGAFRDAGGTINMQVEDAYLFVDYTHKPYLLVQL